MTSGQGLCPGLGNDVSEHCFPGDSQHHTGHPDIVGAQRGPVPWPLEGFYQSLAERVGEVPNGLTIKRGTAGGEAGVNGLEMLAGCRRMTCSVETRVHCAGTLGTSTR